MIRTLVFKQPYFFVLKIIDRIFFFLFPWFYFLRHSDCNYVSIEKIVEENVIIDTKSRWLKNIYRMSITFINDDWLRNRIAITPLFIFYLIIACQQPIPARSIYYITSSLSGTLIRCLDCAAFSSVTSRIMRTLLSSLNENPMSE